MTPQTTQTIFTFCKICECRLHTPEEWGAGLCAYHAIDTAPHKTPDPPTPDIDDSEWRAILAWIDDYLNEPPTGSIPRPNRDS